MLLILQTPHWSHQMYFSNGSFYDQCYLLFSSTHCLSHTFSLSLSIILLSSPPFLFCMKYCLTILSASINKRIPPRTVLISKVTSIQNKIGFTWKSFRSETERIPKFFCRIFWWRESATFDWDGSVFPTSRSFFRIRRIRSDPWRWSGAGSCRRGTGATRRPWTKTWGQCYKTFHGRELRIIVIS